MRFAYILLLAGSLVLTIAGCDRDEAIEPQGKAERDHVWKGQTQALETARSVAKDVELQQSDMDDRLRGLSGKKQ